MGVILKRLCKKGFALWRLENAAWRISKTGGSLSSEKRQEILRERLAKPNAERIFYIKMAIKEGLSKEEIYNLTKIDPWFIHQIVEIVEMEEDLRSIKDWKNLDPELGKRA